ncbi:NAD(P)-dependent alcohol dehydrogenase [Microcoleus sp. herbarium8]|uniref:NAD(P)-dependent alcohol dehydrogenase n=1 Tax=Microcoleus sp. herbarium8 TaxID=3055436 RepID=UPI002FCFE7AC
MTKKPENITMQITALAAKKAGGLLEEYKFDVAAPKVHECLIKVLNCGICHSDLHMIDNDWGQSKYPLVPGHEVIGEVAEIGPQVTHLKVGDRVGVGWQRSSCLHCRDCLRGNENLCDENQGLIVTGPGGFADYLMVDSRFAFPIPKGIDSTVAGPLLCGGITVYGGLRNAGMSSGQEIGILGIGGLGHLAVQFAKKLGNRVTVFTTSQDKAEFAHKMGADEAIVVGKGEVPQPPSSKLDILLSTVPAALDWVPYIDFLDSDGALAFVGVPDAPLSIPLFALLAKRRRITASPIGGRALINEMLSVSEKFGIEPIVEVFAIAQANEAIQKVRDNKVRYRAVLTVS